VFKKDPASEIHWVRYTGADHRIHRERVGTLTDAKAKLEVSHVEARLGQRPVIARAKVTLKATLADLIDDTNAFLSKERSADHAYGQKRQFNRMLPDFGKRPADSLTRHEIIDWLDDAADELEWSDSTYNRYLAGFSLMFRIGIEKEKIHINPVHSIRRRQEDNTRVRFLIPEEEIAITKVLQERHPDYANVFILALHTGTRTSEGLRGTVGDFDPATGMIAIHQTKDIRKPKIRFVPASPKAIAAYQALAAGKKLRTPLCTNRQRDQLYEYRYWMVPAIEASGVTDFTAKDLRHTAASCWVMSGVPLAAVAKYLGHSSIQMTAMRYSHLTPNVNAQATAAMMSFYPATGGATSGK